MDVVWPINQIKMTVILGISCIKPDKSILDLKNWFRHLPLYAKYPTAEISLHTYVAA